ncbi:MAG TPA: sigma 54-interacting transcriptional regulator [Holophagaceae bacterium]|nr:sigma 54-interacting transcriptional regulator [Holophagaceae bacterium]
MAPLTPEELDRILAFAERLGLCLDLPSLGLALKESLAPVGVQAVRVELEPIGPGGQGWSWTDGAPLGHLHTLNLETPLGPVGRVELGFSSAPARETLAELDRLRRPLIYASDRIRRLMELDETHRRLAEERDRDRLLLEITNLLVSHRDLGDLFETLSGALRGRLRHDLLILSLWNEEKDTVRLLYLDFPTSRGAFTAPSHDQEKPLSRLPWAPSIRLRRTMLIQSQDYDSADPEVRAKVSGEGLQTLCSVPLLSRGRVLGVLNFASRLAGAFNEDDVRLMERVSAQVALALDNALAYQEIQALKDRLSEEKLYLEGEVGEDFAPDEVIGESAALQGALRQVKAVAPSDATVLVLGETGTGKELMARLVHEHSRRRDRTFVKLNCAAIPLGLMESELFGHEKGAFTGAIAQKKGRLELADGGTLFLDEVGELPPELQPKLLRALQEREFERVGGTRTISVDVRLVAATNRDLERMVAEGRFRADLYYRLHVFPVRIPPLRERREDIPALVRYFTQKHARRLGRAIHRIPAEVMAALQAAPWAGNIRELENFLERSVILSTGDELRAPLSELRTGEPEPVSAAGPTLEAAERQAILQALRAAKGKVAGPEGAAARLGMKRTTLQSRMKKLGMTTADI